MKLIFLRNLEIKIPGERIEPGTRMDPANELATARLSVNNDSDDYATRPHY